MRAVELVVVRAAVLVALCACGDKDPDQGDDTSDGERGLTNDRVLRRLAVERVADDRRSIVGEVHADLMRASGLEATGDERRVNAVAFERFGQGRVTQRVQGFVQALGAARRLRAMFDRFVRAPAVHCDSPCPTL